MDEKIRKYYEVLGLKPEATDDDVRNAYSDALKTWKVPQGDQNLTSSKLQIVEDAYKIISEQRNLQDEGKAQSSSKRFLDDSETKKCPFCAEIIKHEAIKCRYCGELVDMKFTTAVSGGHIKNPPKSQMSISSSRRIDNSEAPSAWNYTVNKTQRNILLLTVAVLILMLLFPPYYSTQGMGKVSKGYRFIFNPIKMAYWDKEAELRAIRSFENYLMSDTGRALLSDQGSKLNFDFMQDPEWATLPQKEKDELISFAFDREASADPGWEKIPEPKRAEFRSIYIAEADKADQKLKRIRNIYFDNEKKKYPQKTESVPPLVDTLQLLVQAIIVILVGGILWFAFKGNEIADRATKHFASSATSERRTPEAMHVEHENDIADPFDGLTTEPSRHLSQSIPGEMNSNVYESGLAQMAHNRSSRPTKVRTAVTLLYISLGFGLMGTVWAWDSIWEVSKYTQVFPPEFAVFLTFSILGVMFLFIYMIGRGRNWARITYFVLIIVGIPVYVLTFLQSYPANPIYGLLGIGQTVIDIIALVLLFQKPSSNWFREMRMLQ
jgi:hypothetical protein